LFVFWEGYLDVAPTLIGLIRFLSAKNMEIDLLISNRGDSEITGSFDQHLVRVVKLDPDGFFNRSISRIVNNAVAWKFFPGWVKKVNDGLLGKALDRFAALAATNASKYDTAYCVDATGLYVFKKSGIRAEKVINISLEVLDLEHGEHGPTIQKVKQLEKEMLTEEVKQVIIQDQYRADVLTRTVGTPIDKFIFLPNSVEKGDGKQVKLGFFHEKFNLPRETKIVLSAGMIGEAVSSLEIGRAVGNWKPRYPVKIVFHERLAGNTSTPYLDNIRRAGKGHLLLSLQPLPYDQLGKLFSSADIGLAIYNEGYGDNFGVIGSASGKLFQYIKHGLPVIVSDLPGLGELVRDYDMGLVVKSTDEIPTAIEKIFADYKRYSDNASKAFHEDLNMDVLLEKAYAGIAI
jgi:glycosyltransferase involved in cell wall biosynthesis